MWGIFLPLLKKIYSIFNVALNSAFFFAHLFLLQSQPHIWTTITYLNSYQISLNILFIRGGKHCYNPTLHNLFCSRFFRLGRNMCRSHPGTGCTRRTSGRLRATPGPERLSVCTGHGSGFHIRHTWRILASLQRPYTEVTHTKPAAHFFLFYFFSIEVCNIHVSVALSRTVSVLQCELVGFRNGQWLWRYVRDRCPAN